MARAKDPQEKIRELKAKIRGLETEIAEMRKQVIEAQYSPESFKITTPSYKAEVEFVGNSKDEEVKVMADEED